MKFAKKDDTGEEENAVDNVNSLFQKKQKRDRRKPLNVFYNIPIDKNCSFRLSYTFST